MSNLIPHPIISVLADKLPEFETHATLDNLFLYADAPGNAPISNKNAKVQEWLLRTNKVSEEPLCILGKLIESYMELPDDMNFGWDKHSKQCHQEKIDFKNNLFDLLQRFNLTYFQGGVVVSSGQTVSSKTLNNLIQEKNIPAIDLEFHRALENVVSKPLEAISASCNILESICKVYIEEENLEFPNKKDLRSLWKVIAKDLNFDTNKIQDDDLKRILSGLNSIVDGISALRTHGSSAHGQGKKMYKPEPRHARLSVNSAHSLALFILETWNKKKTK